MERQKDWSCGQSERKEQVNLKPAEKRQGLNRIRETRRLWTVNKEPKTCGDMLKRL